MNYINKSAINQEAGREHLLSAQTEKAKLLALYLQFQGVKHAFIPNIYI